MSRVVALAALALLLAACGGSGSASDSAAPTTAPNVATSPTARPSGTLDAAGVVDALKAAGLPVGELVVYDATNDPNTLLGRPHQYTSKVNFLLTSIDRQTQDSIEIDDGGSVEVFANSDDAAARFKYLDAITASSPLFTEYHYQQGLVLLRLSRELTPDVAAQYEAALKGLR